MLRWTNRVSLIWVLWEGLWGGVVIKLPAAGCAEVIHRSGRDTVRAVRAKTSRQTWSVQGAGSMPIRLAEWGREKIDTGDAWAEGR